MIRKSFLTLLLFATAIIAKDSDPLLGKLKKQFPTATTYSLKTPYSDTMTAVYLFYDKDKNLLGGAGMRPFKTYSTINGVLVLKKKDDAFVIDDLFFPDITRKIRKSKVRRYILKLAAKTKGTVIAAPKDEAKKPAPTFDAVTGATPNKRILYLTLNKMTKVLAKELSTPSDWERISLPSGE